MIVGMADQDEPGVEEPEGDADASAGPSEAQGYALVPAPEYSQPIPQALEHPSEPTMPVPVPVRSRDNDLGGLRVVIVLWCFWLLGAWAATWLSDTSVPRVRWMLFAGSFGLMLVWPAFRLSERVEPGDMSRAALQALLDWLAMVVVYQAVIWSLYILAAWPVRRGAWLDGAVLAWSLLSALIVGVARLWPGAWPRLLGMALCVLLVFGEPVAVWFSTAVLGGEGWAMRVSPVQALWELTQARVSGAERRWEMQIMLVGLVGVVGWVGLGLWGLVEKATRRVRGRV